MEKLFLIVLIATAAGAIASRNVRSPGGSGWQGGNNFGRSSPGLSRSSVTSWSSFGNGLSRSAGSDGSRGAWGRSSSNFGSDNQNGDWGKSWQSVGARRSNGYDSNNAWLGRSSGVDDSFGAANSDYTSGWDNSGYNDNNGWQSSAW
ncbi:uncharacterized protein LOC142975408 [Anticarsia gemmatalis]|uniref:uncharacterized protein LOC142975408 n=1 Tax=Anticarsia gemmatalis TaxID=129554 RepID=UPI003F773A3D